MVSVLYTFKSQHINNQDFLIKENISLPFIFIEKENMASKKRVKERYDKNR